MQAPERTVREALVSAVREVVGVEVSGSEFKLSGESRVHVQAHSAIKMAIFEQKHEVLSRANNIIGKEQLRELL